MKISILITLLLFISISVYAQPITFTDVTNNYSLPAGVKLIKGQRTTNPKLALWYFDVDMNRSDVAIKPYLNPVGKEGLTSFVTRLGAFAGINGGYFDTGSDASYSALIEPGIVRAKNIATIVRPAGTFYTTRSLFSFTDTRELSIDWIYHFGNRPIDIYTFDAPLSNTESTPAPAPSVSAGTQYYEILAGIGGGPTLVKNGQKHITYTEEVFFGSGVGNANRDPRTVIGYTADKHVIMMVIDGRQADSEGLSLPEAADLMISLGCVEAMNLDGGGSSTMAVGNQLVNLPAGGTFQRPIPTMLAIVNPDSINLLDPTYYIAKLDNSDSGIVKSGTWAVSNLGGYWSNTPSIFANSGSGESTVKWKMYLPQEANYDVYAWWTAASNRASDAPYIIKHKFGMDTVRLDQSLNGSTWNRIGTYAFTGSSDEGVSISNAVSTTGKVVVADALRIISFDSTLVSVEENLLAIPSSFSLEQNFPNPFNPTTIIRFDLPAEGFVKGVVYDILGREVATLLNNEISAGSHQVTFNAAGIPSGVYFFRLESGKYSSSIKMILMK